MSDPATHKRLPSVAYLKECFAYNEATGEITAKFRPRDHFSSDSSWRRSNTRRAGNRVGTKTKSGHLQVRLNGKQYMAHRIAFAIWSGTDPGRAEVDHINGDPSDNRAVNLRTVTHDENHRNLKLDLRNKTGVPGVYLDKSGKYKVYIGSGVGGRPKSVGTFESLSEAVEKRKDAEAKLGYHANHGRSG